MLVELINECLLMIQKQNIFLAVVFIFAISAYSSIRTFKTNLTHNQNTNLASEVY